MPHSHPPHLLNLGHPDPNSVSYNALYCEEEEGEEEQQQFWEPGSGKNCFFDESSCHRNGSGVDYATSSLNGAADSLTFPLTIQDHSWDEDELPNLLSKEEESCLLETLLRSPSLGLSRTEAAEWMLRVHAHYSFNALTAILAVNYFDRFLSSFQFQREKKPWMTQLAAVACLSLAAKVEETHVPLLLDLQVEGTKYVFEAKTIQRMEILVLSTLGWKMNPVTSHSFVDYITRRLGFKHHLSCEFLMRCERVLVSIISDNRCMSYLPSVIATAAILHVVRSLEPSIGDEYRSQLLGILGSDEDRVEECCQLILELESVGKTLLSNKRKSVSMPGSPNGVIDASFSCDSSDDSYAIQSVSSSPELMSKKTRTVGRQSERFSHLSVDYLSIPD